MITSLVVEGLRAACTISISGISVITEISFQRKLYPYFYEKQAAFSPFFELFMSLRGGKRTRCVTLHWGSHSRALVSSLVLARFSLPRARSARARRNCASGSSLVLARFSLPRARSAKASMGNQPLSANGKGVADRANEADRATIFIRPALSALSAPPYPPYQAMATSIPLVSAKLRNAGRSRTLEDFFGMCFFLRETGLIFPADGL